MGWGLEGHRVARAAGSFPPAPSGAPPGAGAFPLMYEGVEVPSDYWNLRPKLLNESYPCLHKSVPFDPD